MVTTTPTPTATFQGALSDWSRLVARSIEGQARLARGSVALARRVAVNDEGRGSAAGRAYLDSLGREAAHYWTEAVALGLGYADGLLSLAQDTAARVLDDVDAAAGPTPVRPDGGDPGVRRIAVALAGIVGSEIATKVTVANNQPRRRAVKFDVGVLTGPDGPFHPPLHLEPASLTLPAGEEGTVGLRLEMRPDLFTRGETYRGEIRVHGGDEAILVLSVRAE